MDFTNGGFINGKYLFTNNGDGNGYTLSFISSDESPISEKGTSFLVGRLKYLINEEKYEDCIEIRDELKRRNDNTKD